VAQKRVSEKRASSSIDTNSEAIKNNMGKIVNLLALIAVKGESQTEKILTLTAAGFTSSEIASLLRTTPNTVSVTVYQAKSKKKKGAEEK
jgi:DNA-binding CsgD family transcriptional regulator